MAWSFHAYDLASGAAITTLELADWAHEDRIDDAGQFNGTHVSRGATLDRLAIAATAAARCTVLPVRDGVPLGYEGIVWASDQPDFSGASLLSYFDTQTYDPTGNDRTTWTGYDQHSILVDLVAWVQSHGGNIQIDLSQVGLSGVLRDQTWTVSDQKNVGEAIRQKADNLGGYDFDFRTELVDGAPRRRMRMWTPRRGVPYIDQQSPVFTVGGNVYSVPSAPANGANMVTHVIALGDETTSGPPSVRRVARSVRTDLIAAGYPRLTHVLDRNDITTDAGLQATANGYAYYYGATPIDEIVLHVNPNDRTFPWGSWDLGDDCMVVIPVGVDPWWPSGFQQVRRVMAHRWSVDANGERLEVVTGRPLS